jgi:hypothetical protein
VCVRAQFWEGSRRNVRAVLGGIKEECRGGGGIETERERGEKESEGGRERKRERAREILLGTILNNEEARRKRECIRVDPKEVR